MTGPTRATPPACSQASYLDIRLLLFIIRLLPTYFPMLPMRHEPPAAHDQRRQCQRYHPVQPYPMSDELLAISAVQLEVEETRTEQGRCECAW